MLLARVIVAGAAGVTVIASASSGSSLLQPAPLQPDWEMSAGGPHAFARYRAFQQSYPADVADPRLRDFAARARHSFERVRLAASGPRSRLAWTTLGPVTVYPSNSSRDRRRLRRYHPIRSARLRARLSRTLEDTKSSFPGWSTGRAGV